MKISVNTNNYISDLDSLKDIQSSGLTNLDEILCSDTGYIYYSYSLSGIKPNDLLSTESGRWVSKRIESELCSIVDNDYDFESNDATELNNIQQIVILGKNLMNKNSNSYIINDYCVIRNLLSTQREILGWSGLTNIEKEIVIDCYQHDNINDMATFLISVKGMSSSEASDYILTRWHKNYNCKKKNVYQRYYHVEKMVLQHLSMSDAQDLSVKLSDLKRYYIDEVRLGQEYGDSVDGIMDYIESTNGYVGAGLVEESYTPISGTLSDLKDKVSDCIIEGIYNKY